MGSDFDGPVVENATGGKQSDSPFLLRGLPTRALFAVARILKVGAVKYEPDPFGDMTRRNWHKISSDEHLEHVLMHALAYVQGDRTAEHAEHMTTRALFFMHQLEVEREARVGERAVREGT